MINFLLFCLKVFQMSFYDVVLDFVLMDAFDDLANPPAPVVSIMQNKWLADYLKESVNQHCLNIHVN